MTASPAELAPAPPSGLRSAGAVLGRAAVLLARHWPVLLALSLAGLGARGLLMMAAVRVSKLNGVLGYLVMVLVPVTTLVALVLMLRTVRASLPSARALEKHAGSGPRALLDHLGSVLVPFLAVYASYGYLKDDTSQYVYEVYRAEVLSNAALFTDPHKINLAARLPFTISAVLIAVVVAAALLRWGLGRWKGASRRPWLGIFGAYLEVIWITMVVQLLLNVAKDWLTSRRAVQWAQDSVDRLPLVSGSGHGATSWLSTLLGDAGTVIVVPVAWLTVGAVVYGHAIAPPPVSANELFVRAARRFVRLPKPVRKVAADGSASLRDRFGPLVHGLRLLARTGLRPMLLFCLAFLLVQSASDWLWELERLLIGPRDLGSVWVPLSGPLSVVNDAIRTTLLACLLGAAVEQVLRARHARERPAPVASESR